MTALKMGRQAMKEIASVIGIEPDAKVSAMDITMPLGDVVRIKVEFIVTEEQWVQISRAAEKGGD